MAYNTPPSRVAYNQAESINRLLSQLRTSFVSSIISGRYGSALEIIENIHNIIYAKISEEESKEIEKETEDIEKDIKAAEATYIYNGVMYYKNPEERRSVKKKINRLFRKIEKLQDKYGYGMIERLNPDEII